MYNFFLKEPKDTTQIKIHVVEAQKSGTEKGPCRKKIKHCKKKKNQKKLTLRDDACCPDRKLLNRK